MKQILIKYIVNLEDQRRNIHSQPCTLIIHFFILLINFEIANFSVPLCILMVFWLYVLKNIFIFKIY